MAVITKQELENASLDAATLQTVVNGAASPGTLNSRLGTPLKTIAKIVADLAALDIGGSAAAVINQNISNLSSTLNAQILELTNNITGLIVYLNDELNLDIPVTLTQSAFEALTTYKAGRTYNVAGIGTYTGSVLTTRAAFAPLSTDLHVSKSGNDTTGNGTEGNPYLTIAKAFSMVATAGGVTIWVNAGTYTENISSSGYFLISAKSFTAPVTIRSVPNSAVTLQNASGAYLIYFNGACKNIVFRELELRSANTNTYFVASLSTAKAEDCHILDCSFVDVNSKLNSVTISGTGVSTNFSVKRCTFTSSAAFSISVSNSPNARVIGNNLNGTNAGSITVTGGTLSTGTYIVNSNIMTSSIILTGSTSGTLLSCDVKENICRNIAYTGGTAGLPSLLKINNNTVTAGSGVKGISVQGYTTGGEAKDNTVSSLGVVGLAWPDDAASTCQNHVISGNTVTNNGSNGHAILVGAGGTNVTVSGNTTYANNGGNYGMVVKGVNTQVTGNTFTGGNANGIVLKDASGCIVTGNTIYSSKSGAIALEFTPGAFAPLNNTVTGNTFVVTGGSLYSQAGGNIGTGNIVNGNTYQIVGPGVWGSLFGTTVASIAAVRSAWTAGYASNPTNDNTSVSA